MSYNIFAFCQPSIQYFSKSCVHYGDVGHGSALLTLYLTCVKSQQRKKKMLLDLKTGVRSCRLGTTFPLPDNGSSINRDAYFHVQRAAASHNPPVFIDLFYTRPAEGERGP